MLISNLDKEKNNNKINNIPYIINKINTDYYNNYNNTFYPKQYNISNGDELENIKPVTVNITKEITSIKDLITIINENPLDSNINYNIDLKTLYKIKPELIKLNNMIGMDLIKTDIINQILYYIQKLYNFNKDNSDFMHTVLYGPPGTGKTEVAKIIGAIFSKIGVLSKTTFKKVTRADLIAGYLGQTALKTKQVIEESLGGVLFIDEAYALGNSEKKDSFAKECIDTLCEALSNYKDNLMVIIAGYEDELNKCFFNFNPGLESRFIWKYKTEEYSSEELLKIFFKKVKEADWHIKDSEINKDWFKKNIKNFKYYGRSMEILFTKTKIAHSRRVFSKNKSERKKINLEDLDNGYKMLYKETIDETYKTMYM